MGLVPAIKWGEERQPTPPFSLIFDLPMSGMGDAGKAVRGFARLHPELEQRKGPRHG